MLKRIIFIVEMPFTLRDYKRFGVELLNKNGFNVELWDLTGVLHPKVLQNHKPSDTFNYYGLKIFNNICEIYDKLSHLLPNDFIINLVSYNFESLGIYRALSKSDIDYAVFYANALPYPIIKPKGLNVFIEYVKRLASLRYAKVWKRLFMNLPFRFFGIKPACLILASGERCFDYNYPVDRYTETLYIHTLDYDLYLQEKDSFYDEKPMAVFLDEFLPFHPEFILTGEKVPINADKYYTLLNNFFNLVEEKTGFEVVIAAHPRSNYEERPDYFHGRRCIKDKTINLVKECKLILNHCTTAANFANLFYKPIIFITCADFDKTPEGYWIEEIAKWHGKNPIFMDRNNDVDFKAEFVVDKINYDKYRQAYIKIKESQDLPSWQIVANRLKNGLICSSKREYNNG